MSAQFLGRFVALTKYRFFRWKLLKFKDKCGIILIYISCPTGSGSNPDITFHTMSSAIFLNIANILSNAVIGAILSDLYSILFKNIQKGGNIMKGILLMLCLLVSVVVM